LDRISLLFIAPFSFFVPFPVFPREISRQDHLGTTIANYPRFVGSSSL
jgi:hypothetical protein